MIIDKDGSSMFDSQQSIDKFLEKHQADLVPLRQLLGTMLSVSDIRYTYHYLSSLKPEKTHEFIMHIEAVTTGLVIGYGRLFASTDGVTKLSNNLVPEHLRPLHDQIISLRNKRYAHHGAHDSIETELSVEFDGTSFIFAPQLRITVCLGAPKEWAPIFKWLDELMFDTLMKQLDRITRITGFEWKMTSGSPPYWVTEPEDQTEN